MKKLLLVLAATTALTGCATTAPEMVESPTPAAAEVAQAPALAPKPQIGTFGFDTAGMDRAVQPGDNFFQFANGTWSKNTAIPADKSNYGMFTVLDDLSRERTRTLIEEQSKDPNSRIGATFASFMDQAAVDAKGLAPFQPWLSQIKGLNSKAGLSALYASAMRNGVGTPFAGYVGQDDKQPDQYIFSMGQSGLGMPDRDYYLKNDPKLAETKAKYLQHLTNVLTLAGEPNAAARAKAIVDFETQIAQAHWTRVDSRDATKTYNKYTLAQLARTAPGFDFAGLIRGTGAQNVDAVLIAQPTAFTKMAALINKAPLGVLKDQLLVRSLDGYAAFLPSSFDKEQFSFYGNVLGGTPQQEERWKRGVDFTVGVLGETSASSTFSATFRPRQRLRPTSW